jgi:hypothetical protein
MRTVLVAVLLLLAGCATPPRAPDFEGAYARTHHIRMFNGDPDGDAVDTLDIGPTRDGRAVFTITLMFDNAHMCGLQDASAEVTPQGLVYRVTDPDEGGPFTLAIDVTGDLAKLRVMQGTGLHFCGMRGNWFGEKELRKGAPGSNQ